uniref:Transposase n=1 Tax=Heterorhabditis bacteriophora TaxID=37862 RepID=A0A1I7WL94_HETBA
MRKINNEKASDFSVVKWKPLPVYFLSQHEWQTVHEYRGTCTNYPIQHEVRYNDHGLLRIPL